MPAGRPPIGEGKRSIAATFRANGAGQAAAAERTGVSLRTLQRWEAGDPVYWRHWHETIEQIRRDAYAEGILVVRTLMRSAESDAIKLGAARTIITSVDAGMTQRVEHATANGLPMTLDMILRLPLDSPPVPNGDDADGDSDAP